MDVTYLSLCTKQKPMQVKYTHRQKEAQQTTTAYPGKHSVSGWAKPAWVQALPAGQALQSAASSCPCRGLYVPGWHGTGKLAPAGQKYPAGHFKHNPIPKEREHILDPKGSMNCWQNRRL